MSQWAKTTFVIDSLPSESFEGYSNGDNWNGWACPFFNQETAERVLRASERNNYTWQYDEQADAFIVRSSDDPVDYEPEVFTATKVQIDEKSLMLYGIGAYSWIWEAAEPVG